MTQETTSPRTLRLGYNLFIVALTIFSLMIMLVMLLPLDDSAVQLLQVYDNLICVFFLIDFLLNLKAASKKSDYFLKNGGWLDLIGSLPSLGLFSKYLVLLRLARINRLFGISRLLRGKDRDDYLEDLLANRSQYVALITILLAIVVLATASVLVLQFESKSPEASIKTGWDAIWYSVVTITTVGYGDYYPVTFGGRITAIFIMISGVGIIGALASLLSSVLLNRIPSRVEEEVIDSPTALPLEPPLGPPLEQDLASIKMELAEIKNESADLRKELAVLRMLLEKMSVK